ncbi:MAG: hypothetical protein QCH35_03790 [Methanomicrobiaceae archaeon]|nr:hypothetical protein [Methanomicrobiaceae archaeon]
MNLRIAGYAVLLFLLAGSAAAEITLSPEDGAVVGDVITISGTTSFSPQNRVHVEVQSLSFAPTSTTEQGVVAGYATTTAIVEEGGGCDGLWWWTPRPSHRANIS